MFRRLDRDFITVTQIQRWLESGATSPHEQLRKQKLKAIAGDNLQRSATDRSTPATNRHHNPSR